MASSDDGPDDDILMELLTYTCPQTGKSRTAGASTDEPSTLLGFVAQCLKFQQTWESTWKYVIWFEDTAVHQS